MADTLEDFLKKYEGCFVFLEKELVLLDHYDSRTGLLHFGSEELGTITLQATSESFEKVSHKFPERGLYNIDGAGILFERTATRQWKRGICNKNSQFVYMLPWMNGIVNPPRFTSKSIHQLFHPTYITIRQALASKRFQTAALSRELGITIPQTLDYDALLFFHHKAIGTVHLKDNMIKLHDPLFEQEVRDYIRDEEGNSWNFRLVM